MNELYNWGKVAFIVGFLTLFIPVNLYAYEISEAEYDSLAGLFNNYHIDGQNNIETNNIRLLRMARQLEGFSQSEEYHISWDLFNSTDIKKVLIIAKRNVFTEATFHILRYAHDIHNAWGCEVKVFSVNGETETDVKGLITTNSTNLNGVVFVGDIMPSYYYLDTTSFVRFDTTYVWDADTFPCDLYYMDLDGSWLQLNDGSGCFYNHSGNVQPEIFVGRINTSKFSDNEEFRVLKWFLDKDHRYWTGQKRLNKGRALAYTYNDWRKFDEFREGIEELYGEIYTDSVSGNAFSKQGYKNCLENTDYEFIQLSCHSDMYEHYFSEGFTVPELDRTYRAQIGYNLYCCNACKWTQSSTTNCLGESYLYGGDDYSDALALVGSTKIGSMLGFSEFYEPLGNGACIGYAFKEWWRESCGVIHSKKEKAWHYGMCLFGDPLVNFNFTNECEDELTVSGIELTNSSYYAQSKITLHNYAVYGNQEVTLNAPIIEITGNFICDKPAKLETNINDYCACNNNQGSAPARRQNAPAAIETSVSESKEFFCFPNPAREILYIECPSPLSKAHIYNLNGQLVLQTSETQIDVSSLSSGVYIVHAQTRNGQLLTAKFVHL